MVSVIGFTSLALDPEKQARLLSALNEAGQSVFPGQFRFLLRPFDPRFCSTNAQGLINCIAAIPASTTMDEKRRLSAALHETTVSVLGDANRERVTILFWNHEPNAFAVDGTLCSAAGRKG